MRSILILMLAFLFQMKAGITQEISVKGVVMEEMQDGSLVPLEFVSVVWLKSTRNTTTDSTGYFFIAHSPDDGDKLVFTFLGFDPDTVTVAPGQYISVLFKEEANMLGEVVVSHRKRTTEISFLDPLQEPKKSRC
jgi:TonB-dependent starch-binding outer membrane protein SusC